MKKSIIALVIMLMTTLVSCGGNGHGDYSKIYESYYKMNDYTAKVKVTVNSESGENVYTANQSFLSSGMYRIDYTSDIMEGINCVLKDEVLYYKDAEGTVNEFKGYVPYEKNYIFINDFFERYCKTEEAKSRSEGSRTILTLKENSDNPHRAYMELYLNKKQEPERLITYNDKGKKVIMVEFLEFNLNTGLKEKDFKL